LYQGENVVSDLIVAPETRDLAELSVALETWLAGKMPSASGIKVDNLDYPRGAGMSHETILFDMHWLEGGGQEQGAAHSRGCVVRIKPGDHTVFPDDLFDQQIQLMQAMHAGNYCRVAEIYWVEQDPSILGKPFFVMEKKLGRVPVSMPPYSTHGWVSEATDAQHRKIWEEGVRQLAMMQRVPISELRFLEGPAHAREGLAQEWDKYVRFVEWVGDHEAAPVLRSALNRLKGLWPENQPEGVVWGDARIGNMMYNEQFEVIAVMDWEQPSLGGALHDLAWFLVLSDTMHGPGAQRGRHLPGMGTREETIALWEQISGKSTADIEWYEDFTQVKMACTGVRLGSLRGEVMQSVDYLRVRLKVG
jgi:aminoglycoside phosphotransferase (APT) family kinase protein